MIEQIALMGASAVVGYFVCIALDETLLIKERIIKFKHFIKNSEVKFRLKVNVKSKKKFDEVKKLTKSEFDNIEVFEDKSNKFIFRSDVFDISIVEFNDNYQFEIKKSMVNLRNAEKRVDFLLSKLERIIKSIGTIESINSRLWLPYSIKSARIKDLPTFKVEKYSIDYSKEDTFVNILFNKNTNKQAIEISGDGLLNGSKLLNDFL
jgi:hypothetical protein